MKKTVLFASIILFAIISNAQDTVSADTAWKVGGQFVFTFSQATFKDWAPGGDNSYAGNSRLGLFANYVKGKVAWENNLDMAYGLSHQKDFRKNDDMLELNSKYGRKASDKLFYTALFNAKTQFDEGRKYLEDDSTYNVVSKFASPLNINFALGIDYKPNKYTSIFLSPINSKLMYVKDDSLLTVNSLEDGEHYRYELGFIAKMKYEREVVKNINLMSKLDLFADYLQFESLEDIDVSWEVLITMNVFKVLSVNLNTHLIWDNDVMTVNDDGTLGDAKVQFKEIFGAGLSYKF